MKSIALTLILLFSTIGFLTGCDGVDLTGCDCDKEIDDLIDHRGQPDEKEQKIENSIHTLIYRYFSDGYVHTFVWGKDTEKCCEETFSTSGNTAPVAMSNSVFTSVNEPVDISLQATDEENDPLSYIVITNPIHGTLSGSAPTLIYRPQTDFIGQDRFQFKANDGKRDSNIATIDITVTEAGSGGGGNQGNTPPVAQNQTVATKVNTDINISLTATDADNDTLTYKIVNSPRHGDVSGTPPNITYSPDTDYTGSDDFSFKANDGTADSNRGRVNITIQE